MPGVRGRVVGNDESDPRTVAKKTLTRFAIEKYELSWAVGKFSGQERWALMAYRIEGNPAFPGALVITDIHANVDVMTYAAPGIDWHSVRLEYRWQNAWHVFLPEEALQQWRSAEQRWLRVPDMPAEGEW
jgi:hypothetical protein